MKICVLLTQYKRIHLKEQLEAINKQTLQPDYLIVFQNENHVNIDNLKLEYNFIHVKSDFNTKYFGRFNYCFNIPADIFIIIDDDLVPGFKCIENYVKQCNELNSIIGGNGRIGYFNTNKLNQPPECGIRNLALVDFVGHIWCFKKEWLYYMFSIVPYTYDTSEDMHLCYSAKLLGNINSYCAKQNTIDESNDIVNNKYSSDIYSSYKTTNKELRENVEKYFLEKGLNLIEHN